MGRRQKQKFRDRDRLMLFVSLVEDATTKRRATAEGTMRAEMKISWPGGGGTEVSAELGVEDDNRSLMIDIRKLLMDGEPTNFQSISGLLHGRLTDETLRSHAADNHKMWRQIQREGLLAYHLDGKTVRPIDWFELVAYGGVFHSDPAKVELWHHLDPISQMTALTQTNIFMARALKVAVPQKNIVVTALEQGLLALEEDQ